MSGLTFLKRRVDDVGNRDHEIRIVGERPYERRTACLTSADATSNQSTRCDEQSRARCFNEALIPQASDALPEPDESIGGGLMDAAFVCNNGRFDLRWRKIEIKRDETLPSAGLEILDRVLIAGIVGDHDLKSRRRFDQLTRSLDR